MRKDFEHSYPKPNASARRSPCLDPRWTAPSDSCTSGRAMRTEHGLHSNEPWPSTSGSAIHSRPLERANTLPRRYLRMLVRLCSMPRCARMSNSARPLMPREFARPTWGGASSRLLGRELLVDQVDVDAL